MVACPPWRHGAGHMVAWPAHGGMGLAVVARPARGGTGAGHGGTARLVPRGGTGAGHGGTTVAAAGMLNAGYILEQGSKTRVENPV